MDRVCQIVSFFVSNPPLSGNLRTSAPPDVNGVVQYLVRIKIYPFLQLRVTGKASSVTFLGTNGVAQCSQERKMGQTHIVRILTCYSPPPSLMMPFWQ